MPKIEQTFFSHYNKIANQYEQATLRPMRKFCYEETVNRYINNLNGKRVLDIGCAEGISSRMMKELGAKEVVAFDESSELINMAKEKGGENIAYHEFDIFNENWKNSFGKFDVVTGILIIHYAYNKEKLSHIFKQIKDCLNESGIFYALTGNPDILKIGYENYGVKISKAEKEGDEVLVELHDLNWNKFCEFSNYYWSKETYTKIMENLGFEVEFKPGLVSDTGIKKFGEEFWRDYFKNPIYSFIVAKKV